MSAVTAIEFVLAEGRDLYPAHDYEPAHERPSEYADLYVAGVYRHYRRCEVIYYGFDGGQTTPVVAGQVQN